MNWETIEEIKEKRESNYVEATVLGGIIIPLIKMKKYNLYLYGRGAEFDSILLYLRTNDMDIKGILYFDENKGG